jgi:RNA polymerase sigma-70 factor (ECF subfamily)
MADIRPTQDDLYREAVASCGTALDRVARAYEADPDKRRDLLQENRVALWQRFENFEGRCSLKTWVYRVAHNTATSVVIRKKARAPAFVDLEEVEASLQNESEQVLDHQPGNPGSRLGADSTTEASR